MMKTDTPAGAEQAEAIYDAIHLILDGISLSEHKKDKVAREIYDLVDSAYRDGYQEGFVDAAASLSAAAQGEVS